MAATKKGNGPARTIGPRPCYVLFKYDAEGHVQLDTQGKPVVGAIPSGEEGEGEPAVTRRAEKALAWADADPSLRFVRVMVK